MKKNIKTFLSLFFTLLFISVFSFYSTTALATDYELDPTVELGDTDTKLNILKGSPFEATFNFKHEYYNRGLDIIINVSSPNGSVSLGKKSFSSKKNEINTDPDDSSYSYCLTIPEKYMKRTGDRAGTLLFSIKYYDNNKKVKTFTVQKTVFDPNNTESNSIDDGRLSIQSFKLDHSPIKEGEKFNVTFNIKNNGTTICNNVMTALDTSAAEGIDISETTDTQYINTIEAGQTASITYPMTCISKMVTNNYTLSLTISANELSNSITSKVSIPITGTKRGKDDSNSPSESKPQIIIENYDYGGKPVMGGQEFNLSMQFKNTNTLTKIENLKITVSSVAGNDDKSVAGAFTPAKSSNTFFVAKVDPNASFHEQIALIPKSDATPNSYGVSIAFNYQAVLNDKREDIQSTEIISIPLTQSDRFEVNNPDLPEQLSLDEPCQLNINYVNKSKSKIFNLAVKLEGNFKSTESYSYIGNVDSGTGDSFQANLMPSAEGSLKGKATFSYEDSTGATKTIIKDFSCEILPMENIPVDGGFSEAKPVEQKSGPSPLIIGLIIVTAVIGGIIAIIIIHKKRKAKKLLLLEEDDDYDDTIDVTPDNTQSKISSDVPAEIPSDTSSKEENQK